MSSPRRARARARSLPFVAALSLCAAALAVAAPVRLHRGDPAPDYVGVDRDGRPVLLSGYAGKIVVLSFWASWCGPCKKELPILEGIAQNTGRDRLEVIAVNIESSDVFHQLSKKSSALAMLVTSDAKNVARPAYGVSGIPHMVIVGRDGRVLRVHHGYSDDGVDEAIADLNAALAD